MFENLRQYIKKITKERNLNYSEIGKFAGIEESTVKAFMCGANDSRRTAERIADALGIALVYSNGNYDTLDRSEPSINKVSRREILIATIEDTFLGNEEHGIFTFALKLIRDCTVQWFGYYPLDDYNKTLGKRVFTSYGMELINEVMKTVGVNKWEDLKGKECRFVDEGFMKSIHTIGNITEDRWLDVPTFCCEHNVDHAEQTIYCDDVPAVIIDEKGNERVIK